MVERSKSLKDLILLSTLKLNYSTLFSIDYTPVKTVENKSHVVSIKDEAIYFENSICDINGDICYSLNNENSEKTIFYLNSIKNGHYFLLYLRGRISLKYLGIAKDKGYLFFCKTESFKYYVSMTFENGEITMIAYDNLDYGFK